MNEIVAITSFVGLATLVLTAARLGTISLFVLSATFIVLSNITVQMPVSVFGVEISWAIIIYSLVYFITDLLCEIHGKAAGYRLAATNLSVQVILWAYVWASLHIVPTPSGEAAYINMGQMFSTTKQVSVAALVASVGPFLDIYIFSWVRRQWDAVAKKFDGSEHPLGAILRSPVMAVIARNKLSTFAGQVVNTIVFFSLAYFNTAATTQEIVSIIISASVVKIVVAIADVPFLIAAQRFLLEKKQAMARTDVMRSV